MDKVGPGGEKAARNLWTSGREEDIVGIQNLLLLLQTGHGYPYAVSIVSQTAFNLLAPHTHPLA